MILLITLLCIYYHFKILHKFVNSHTPSQPPPNFQCQYENIPKEDFSKLSKCKSINGIQTYIYNFNGTNYEISPTQQFYAKVCSGFCTDGISNTGQCKTPANQKLFEECEKLLQPKQSCISSAKPVLDVTDDSSTQYYYAVAPINSLNSCS